MTSSKQWQNLLWKVPNRNPIGLVTVVDSIEAFESKTLPMGILLILLIKLWIIPVDQILNSLQTDFSIQKLDFLMKIRFSNELELLKLLIF